MTTCRSVLYSLVTFLALVDAASAQAPAQSAPNAASPSATASPHQKQSPGTPTTQAGKTDAKLTMKGCMAREQADHTGMTQAEARKSCKEQLKATPPK